MRAWLAVTRRETEAFFGGAVAPVVLTAFLLLTGFTWANALLDYAELSRSAASSGRAVNAVLNLHDGVFQPVVAGMALLLMMVMPAVTMRLFAEEYRSRRSDLVFTWPVTDAVWVLGKWSSAVATALALVLAAAPFLALNALFGPPEPGPVAASLIGLLLASAMAAAWGVVFSALVSHQLTAWLLGFGFAMALQTVGHAEPHLPPALGEWALRLSLPHHLGRFTQGVVTLADVAYFAFGTALALTAAVAVISGRRLAGARRGGRWMPAAALLVLALLGNLLAERAAVRADWTADGRRSLAPQTERVLGSLAEPVHVTAFYQRLDPDRRVIEDLLARFAERADAFSWEIVNPDVDLARVRDMGVTAVRTVVVQSGDRRRTVLNADEGTLVNAVFRAAEGETPVVYYLTGHGEPALDDDDRGGYSAFAEILGREGYVVRPLVLGTRGAVPGDASVVVVAAPREELGVAEVASLHAFTASGGAVLMMLDPGSPSSLDAWAEVYNVRLDNTFVVSTDEATRRLTGDRRVVAVLDYPRHDITRGLPGMAAILPFPQPLSPLHDGIVGVETRTFVSVGSDAWAETDPLEVRDNAMAFDEAADRAGPLSLAVALEIDHVSFYDEARISALASGDAPSVGASIFAETLRQVAESRAARGLEPSVFSRGGSSRIVVMGDSDFAANAQVRMYGNGDLLLNTVGWLAREQALIQLRARSGPGQPLLLEEGQAGRIWSAAVVWALAVGLLATVRIVLRRRR